MEAFISRFRYQASKAKLVQSRASSSWKKSIRLEPPAGSEKPPSINFPNCERSARRVFELNGAVKRYGDLTVYDGVDLVIERGSRIALVGPNGAGKSTMMKMLAGLEPMTAGERSVGGNVAMGYFAQNLADSLDYNKTRVRRAQPTREGMTHAARFATCSARCCSRATTCRSASGCCRAASARAWRWRKFSRIATTACCSTSRPTTSISSPRTPCSKRCKRFPGTVHASSATIATSSTNW